VPEVKVSERKIKFLRVANLVLRLGRSIQPHARLHFAIRERDVRFEIEMADALLFDEQSSFFNAVPRAGGYRRRARPRLNDRGAGSFCEQAFQRSCGSQEASGDSRLRTHSVFEMEFALETRSQLERVGVEIANVFSVRRGPGGDVAFEISRKHAFAVLGKSSAEREFVYGFEFLRLRAVRVPKSDVVVPATSHQTAIAAIADPESAFIMRGPVFGLFAFLHFPKFGAAIFAARSEQL